MDQHISEQSYGLSSNLHLENKMSNQFMPNFGQPKLSTNSNMFGNRSTNSLGLSQHFKVAQSHYPGGGGGTNSRSSVSLAAFMKQFQGQMLTKRVTQMSFEGLAALVKEECKVGKESTVLDRGREAEQSHVRLLQRVKTMEKARQSMGVKAAKVSMVSARNCPSSFDIVVNSRNMTPHDLEVYIQELNSHFSTLPQQPQKTSTGNTIPPLALLKQQHEHDLPYLAQLYQLQTFQTLTCEQCSLIISRKLELVMLECECAFHASCIQRYMDKLAAKGQQFRCPNAAFQKCAGTEGIDQEKVEEIERKAQAGERESITVKTVDVQYGNKIQKCFLCLLDVLSRGDLVIISCKCTFHLACLSLYIDNAVRSTYDTMQHVNLKQQILCPAKTQKLCSEAGEHNAIPIDELKYVRGQTTSFPMGVNFDLLQNLQSLEKQRPECLLCLKVVDDAGEVVTLDCGCCYHAKCIFEALFQAGSEMPEKMCPNSFFKKAQKKCAYQGYLLKEEEIEYVKEKFKEVAESRSRTCPFCQYRQGFLLFDDSTCQVFICNRCFNDWVQIVFNRVETTKAKDKGQFFNCQSLTLLLNENNFEKVQGCHETHYFNYFKLRAFMEHVVYMDSEFRAFIFDIVWPNKCDEHLETAAARVDKKNLQCMRCFKVFALKENQGDEQTKEKGAKEQSFCNNCSVF